MRRIQVPLLCASRWQLLAPGANVLMASSRALVHYIDAKSFETDVLQSQDAVCLMFYLPQNAACQQQLASCDAMVTKLNDENGSAWLKLCAVDGDKNRNLASALSVQRSKLPTSFFLMNATIIDRVSGNIPEARMSAILRKFQDHFNVMQGRYLNDQSTPLAAAATADLTSGAPTAFLQSKIFSSLIGPEMIKLPQEAAQMEGIKKLIQQTKEQAYRELQDLHKSIGMDVRKLSNEELMAQYFSTEVYKGAAVLASLEALFLARVYGSVGQLDAQLVNNALAAVRREFEMVLSDPLVRRVLSLVEVNLVRGKWREALPKIQSKIAAGVEGSSSDEIASAQDDLAFFDAVMRWIEFVDGRQVFADPDASGASSDFPTQLLNDMFSAFRANVIRAKKDEKAASRSADVRALLMALMHLFPKDPQSIAARSRLSSMMF
jgi:thioredoxin-like negative regulator of GroEL